MLIDTHTYPEPWKTEEDLWWDLRVTCAYGNQWEQYIRHRSQDEPNSVGDMSALIDALSSIAARRRPLADDFSPDPGFRTEELGYGSPENYWRTQDTFQSLNKKRAAQHQEELVKLAKARQVLSKTYRE